MVHIDPATLRKYPIVGVLIGGVTAVVLGGLLLSGANEARSLLSQRAPDLVSIHEAVQSRDARWVTLTEGVWHCDRAITTERAPGLERWVRGPVETTEVPITGAIVGETVVASFDGRVECDERARAALTGVVGSTQIFTSRSALRRWGSDGRRVAMLHVGASPTFALVMLVGLAAIELLGVAFAGYYLALMLRARRQRPAGLPSMEPIQPS